MYQEATNATRPHISRGGLQDYITLGYVSVNPMYFLSRRRKLLFTHFSHISYVTSEDSDTSASLTLSYAYDDWALSTIAAYLGYNGDQAMFFNRSKNYRNVFNPENQYMCARSKTGAFQ